MKYALASTNFGSYADPRTIARLAALAEHAGWDSFFVWDHLAYVWDGPTGDPWILLAAASSATSRLRLGTAISPIPRYSPHLLAGTLTTLDALSGGRMILGAGLGGVPDEFTAFGGPEDAGVRAAMTDESLAVIDALWSGETVSRRGEFYTVEDVRFSPRPVQRPRIPIWIGGNSAAALRRAARWDGWIADSASESAITMTPDDLARRVERLRVHRGRDDALDVAFSGYTAPSDAHVVEPYRRAGATWWLESIHDLRGTVEAMAERIEAGPPRR